MILPFTAHGWLNTLHGVVVGGGYLVLLVLALVALLELRGGELTPEGTTLGERRLGMTVAAAAGLAWVAAVSGTWALSPWFHAHTPYGAATLLLARPSLSFWARWVIGSKLWVAWASVCCVSLAAVCGYRWRRRLAGEAALRRRLAGLLGGALVTAAYAGAVGALLAKLAPVR